MTSDAASSDQNVRRCFYCSGRVQGVGFRYTARQIASQYAVTGFVRNLPDGRVEMVAEGIRSDLDRFERAVASAMSGYIRDVVREEQAPTGEFSDFRIAF